MDQLGSHLRPILRNLLFKKHMHAVVSKSDQVMSGYLEDLIESTSLPILILLCLSYVERVCVLTNDGKCYVVSRHERLPPLLTCRRAPFEGKTNT